MPGRLTLTVIVLVWLLWLALNAFGGAYPLLLLPVSVFSVFVITSPMPSRLMDHPGIVTFGLVALIRYLLLPSYLLLTGEADAYPLVTDRAVILMGFEAVVVLSTLAWSLRRSSSSSSAPAQPLMPYTGVLAPAIIGAAFVAGAMYPQVLARYHTLLTPASALLFEQAPVVSGSVSLIVTWGYRLLPLVLSDRLIRLIGTSRRNLSYAATVVVFLLLTVATYTGVSRQSALVPGVAALFYILRRFPDRRRLTLIVMAIGLVASFMVMTQVRTEYTAGRIGRTPTTSLVRTAEAYFNGYSNLEIALTTRDVYGSQFTAETALTDIFGNVPGTHMDLSNRTAVFFNYVFYGGGPSQDQIIPFTGQALFHWGLLLCWVPMVGVVLMLGVLDGRFARSTRTLEAYLYSIASVVMGMAFMLNFSIMGSYLFGLVLPAALIASIGRMRGGRGHPGTRTGGGLA